MAESILFGIASVIAVVFAIDALRTERPFFSVILCVSAVFLLAFFAYNWQQVLIGRGQDAALLGFSSCPQIAIGAAVILAADLVILALGIAKASKALKNKNQQ